MLTIEELKAAKEALKLVRTQMKVKHMSVDVNSIDIFIMKAMKDKEQELAKVIEAIEIELERLLFEEEFIEKETRERLTVEVPVAVKANGYEPGKFQVYVVNMLPTPANENVLVSDELEMIFRQAHIHVEVRDRTTTDPRFARRMHFYSDEISIEQLVFAVNVFRDKFYIPPNDLKIDCLTFPN